MSYKECYSNYFKGRFEVGIGLDALIVQVFGLLALDAKLLLDVVEQQLLFALLEVLFLDLELELRQLIAGLA